MPSEQNLLQQIHDHIQQLVQSAAEAEYWHRRILDEAHARRQQIVDTTDAYVEQALNSVRLSYDQQSRIAEEQARNRTAEIEERYRQDMAEARVAYESAISVVHQKLDALSGNKEFAVFSWQYVGWDAWDTSSSLRSQSQGRNLADPVRIGQLTAPDPWTKLPMLALVPVITSHGVLFKATGAPKRTAVQAIQSLLLRLLAVVPPGELRFTFVDPIGLGQNAAPFMHLADYDDALVTGKTWTEPHHIEQRLADLQEHIGNVIGKYMRNEFATIEEYNAQAGEIAEPYRFLVVFDFPANFNENAAQRLVSIAQNGPRCGVYTVVLLDTAKPLPHGFALTDLEQASSVIAWDGQRYIWKDPDFEDCLLELDVPPHPQVFNRIINEVGETAKDASRVEVPFERIAPPPDEWWTGDSRAGLQAALGPTGARKVQYLELGKGTTHHVLLAGRVGSGKSTLLHTLITSLALNYSPEEVQLYLIDFKKGVEFKTYATNALPHAPVIAIESEREFGLSVLQGLDVELKRRGDLFRYAGVDSIADYRTKNGSLLPRILLLVDEFQEFFSPDDIIARQCSQILDRLVRQGRAFGIHVLLGSQTLAGSYQDLTRSTTDQMGVRIALQCSEADSRLILADDNPAARLLSRPGEAIYNAANGMVEGNNLFQVARLPAIQHDRYLSQISALAKARDYRPQHPRIVFEGNAAAEIENNQLLSDILEAPVYSVPRSVISAWLGEPIAIKESTAAHFRRQSASNLIVVGQRAEAALGMLSAALLSLAAHHAPIGSGSARFYILDFTPADAPYADTLPRLTEVLPQQVHRGSRRQVPAIIDELASEVTRRLSDSAARLSSEPNLYLVINGLQRARDLRPDEDIGLLPFNMSSEEELPPSPARQLASILRDGPELGIHSLIWCDTFTNLLRTLDRPLLREFDQRICFQMSTQDSANLLDSPAASQLGSHRAILYSEEEGRLEKFRPYGLPSDQWLESTTRRLHER